ncbi:MAG: DUF4112 domain-containing protein [Candidatus Peregrinibacteria bacterium]|nr:DUF4112 domain-containing protein [Candidatus Peregrinibacteria bacterium]
MSLPTGAEEDDIIDTTATHTPNTPAETGTALAVTPEIERQAEEGADQIVCLAQDVEIMAATRGKLEAALGRSEFVAGILDEGIVRHVPILKHIPIVRSISVESLVGAIPVLGDVIGAGASLYIVAEAHLAGVPFSEIKKMLIKIAIDSGVGAIPGVGDIFDIYYKSNKKNVEIFRQYVTEYIAQHEGKVGAVADAQARKRFEDSRNLG